MRTLIVRLFFLCCWIGLTGVSVSFAQQPTTSTFPNRFTGRQIVVAVGSESDRPEYRLLDSGLMYYREGSEGPYRQLGQYPKEKTQQLFTTLEQDCKIKTTKLEAPERPAYSVTWKRVKTEFSVVWSEENKAPEAYQKFLDEYLKIFPAVKK